MRLPIICMIIACAFSAPTKSSAASSYSADWVQANAAKLNGKHHSIRISWAQPGRVEGKYQWFGVSTDDGWISVRILHKNAPAFLSRYASSRERKRLDGIVRVDEGYVYIDATGDQVRSAHSNGESKIRIWTHEDGRTIEAEYLTSTSSTVRIRRTSDASVFELELSTLSDADRAWVAAQ